MSDEELIKRIRQGDVAAEEELIRRYYAPILRFCGWRCKDREAAEDLTQETFFRLFRSLSHYREGGNFKAYLFSIAKRLCIDERGTTPLYPLEGEESYANERDELQRAEERSEIDILLGVLSPEQREAIILRYGEQLSFREIAKVMGCNLRTAQSRVRRALQIMREVWNDET